MPGPRQYSLGYLFLEIFWIAAALGCATHAYRLPSTPDIYVIWKIQLGIACAICGGAAFGGLFRDMVTGVLVVHLVLGGFAVMAVVAALAMLLR